MSDLPEFLTVRHIVGDRENGVAGLVPVGESTWFAGVKSGRYPKPVKFGPKTSRWRREDILKLRETGVPA